jgi:hypothetical protein
MNDETAAPPSSFLSVGLPLKLCFQQEGGKVRVGSTLLGWKAGAWVVCEWPFHDQQAVACAAGTPCLVSSVYEGKLVGYRSEVREAQTLPVPLLFLAFPKTVEEFHLRKHVRVPANEPVILIQTSDVVDSAGAGFLGGLLKDVSECGCSVMLAQLPLGFRTGTRVKMEFALPGVGRITNLSGVVKNLQEIASGVLLGIEFRFNEMEYIEFRGWGGSVRQALERCTLQQWGDR